MKKIHYIILIFELLSMEGFGQDIFVMELANIKKMQPSAKKDSLMVDILFQINQVPSEDVRKWLDSLKIYSINNKSRIAQLLYSIKESDYKSNYDFAKGGNALLTITNELIKNKYYAYASFAFLRIGAIYNYQLMDKNDITKALPYYEKALELASLSHSDLDIIRAYDYIGEYYLTIEDYEKAIFYLKIAEKKLLNYKIQSISPTVYSSLASCYLYKNKIKLAEMYYQKSIEKLNNTDYNFQKGYQMYIKQIYLSNATKYFFKNKNYKKSLSYGLNGLALTNGFIKTFGRVSDFENYSLNFLEIIHKDYFELGDFENSYKYLITYEKIKNSVEKSNMIKEFKELNIKYQTDQSKLKITALTNESLKKEVEKQSTFRFSLIALACLLLLLIVFIYYSNIRLRKKNKEISVAMLKGQTIERKRVAADLHDSLGSTMSSLIYTVNAIDTNHLDHDEKNVYLHLKQMLDTAYNEIRLLSHNLLPEEFEKQGLAEALRYFVRKINQTKTIQFDLSIDPQLGRLSPKIEFELYSICLELINNILKHSKATQASITLAPEKKLVKLVISDNGHGFFDNDSDGKGMKNVKARIESLHGTWHTKSTEGNGVCNEISVPI
jgi:signal transduction histidine kinase